MATLWWLTIDLMLNSNVNTTVMITLWFTQRKKEKKVGILMEFLFQVSGSCACLPILEFFWSIVSISIMDV